MPSGDPNFEERALRSFAATNAVTQYFQTLNFGDTYVPSDLTVAVVNALTGLVSGVSITPTSPVTALPYQRVILSSLTINISAG